MKRRFSALMTQTDNRPQEQYTLSPDGKPRLRFAPSPTGYQHIGGYRTALFDWLYARHTGGTFILRIEDTDIARTVEGSVEFLIEGMKWLGMDYDEGPYVGGPYGPYYETQRKAIYQYYADQLIASGHAYRCYCTPERLKQLRAEQVAQKLPPRYDRLCRYLTPEERAANEAAGKTWTVRFAMPTEGETVVHDELRGDIVFDNADFDDQIILKSDGYALYHLAHLVDDHLMGITHVLRGDEWISSAPLHVQIYKAFGWQQPLLYHVPTVLGWAYDDKTELFTPEELIKAFTLDRVGIAGGIYDPAKLTWMNGVYIRQLSLDDLTQRTIPYLERPEVEGGLPDSIQRPLDREYTSRVLQLEQERLKTLGEAAPRVAFFYTGALTYDPALLVQKKMDVASTRAALIRARDLLVSLKTWTHEAMETPMSDLAVELGLSRGQLFGAVRVAVSGSTATPPLFQMMEVLGRERCMTRIEQAIAKLA